MGWQTRANVRFIKVSCPEKSSWPFLVLTEINNFDRVREMFLASVFITQTLFC